MFTLLVSWLLVACVPGLLMLATLGLGRLERLIAREPDDIDGLDVHEFLERAEAVDMHTLASEGMPEAMEYLHRHQSQHLDTNFARHLGGPGEEELPPRIHRFSRDNPLDRATGHINRV